MKLMIGLLFLSHTVFAKVASVPSGWIGSSSSMTSFKTNSFLQTNELEESYKGLIDYKQSMLESLPENKKKRWYLQSIKTELGISASGEIGVMGTGGEAALEFIWIKKKKNSNQLVSSFNEEISNEGQQEAIQITSEMSEEALKKEIEPIVDLALKAGRIKRRGFLFKNLFNRALDFQKTIRELEGSPAMGSWYAYKYQLELGVSAEGHVTPFLEIGQSLRLRMEWWKIAKENTPLMLSLPQEQLSENTKFVAAVAQDLSFIGQDYFDNGFVLNCIKIGVGTTVKGNLVIAKSKALAKGSIFFLRNEKNVVNQNLFPSSLAKYDLQDNKMETHEISRGQFRKAIHKGADIINFFARNAPYSNENKKFELNVIEAEFEFFTGGGIGLVTVEGSAGITIFATRNVII
jgi:hypothetical protein